MAVTLRAVKGSALTSAEGDANLAFLTGPSVARTIAAGVITADGTGWYRVDTEAAAASDDLTQVNGTVEGDLVQLYAANAARTVVVKHGAAIKLNGGVDFIIEGLYSTILLRSAGSNVLMEVTRTTIPAA